MARNMPVWSSFREWGYPILGCQTPVWPGFGPENVTFSEFSLFLAIFDHFWSFFGRFWCFLLKNTFRGGKKNGVQAKKMGEPPFFTLPGPKNGHFGGFLGVGVYFWCANLPETRVSYRIFGIWGVWGGCVVRDVTPRSLLSPSGSH